MIQVYNANKISYINKLPKATVWRYIFPFFDPEVQTWSLEARLLRWLTFLWMFIGLIVMYSASYPVADAESGDGLYYFKRQILWLLIGLIFFNIVVRTPLRNVVAISHWVLLALLGLIIMTLIPGMGSTVNGATRWISIGILPIQPSELMKPFLVIQSAKIFGQWEKLTWKVRLTWVGIFGLVLCCILLQPNLSTTALCGMTLWLIALAGGVPFLYLGGTALAGIAAAVISISHQDYQRRRVMSFLDPWADPMQDGYQLIQSLLAIGSGGALGSGFGLSQQKLFYLPIQYTDFIFAVFAEEFGFVGCVLLLIMLASYASLGSLVSLKCRHPIYRLIGIGVVILLIGQSLLNIGVATGALPTTGLPFPLFSYGGSSSIASLILAGFLIRVARETNEATVIPLDRKMAAYE